MSALPSFRVRAGIAFLASALGSLALEAALRLVYPALPSVAGLEGSDFRLETLVDAAPTSGNEICRDAQTFLSHRSRWAPTHGVGGPGMGPPPGNAPPPGLGPPPGMSPPGAPGGTAGRIAPPLPGQSVVATEFSAGEGPAKRSIWLVGDSVTYGLGVAADETFGAGLTKKLADKLGEAVTQRNLGVPGGGYCTSVRRLASEMQSQAPDLVFIVFFADDLEEHSLLNVQGHLILPPDAAGSAGLRWLVDRSYLANLAWYRAVSWSGAEPTTDGRFISPATIAEFQRAAVTMNQRVVDAGGHAIFVALPAPSAANCDRTKVDSRCRWLADDLDVMANQLTSGGLAFVDLRGMWPRGTEHIVDGERDIAVTGGVAMHPNEAGHRMVAEAIWAQVTAHPEFLGGK